MKLPDNFCVQPWIELHLDEGAKVFPCCLGRADPEWQGTVDQGKQPSLENLWNNKSMVGLRKQFMAGEWPKACQWCKTNEDNKRDSYRTSKNLEYASELKKINFGDGSGILDPNFIWFDLRLGNKCNLKCRMCDPRFSNLLEKEYAEIFPGIHNHLETYWEQLDAAFDVEAFKTAKNLHMAGGEPFVITKTYEIMKLLIESGRAPEVHVTFNSNITVIPKELESWFKHFKKITIYCSLDGWGPMNNYIRYPAVWDKTLSNLGVLNQLQARFSNLEAVTHTVVQIYNAFHLPVFAEQVMAFPLFKNQKPLFDFVMDRNFFSIQALPAALKMELAEKYNTWLGTLEKDKREKVENDFRSILTYMNAADLSDQLGEFSRVTKAFDKSRSQNLAEIEPRLAQLL